MDVLFIFLFSSKRQHIRFNLAGYFNVFKKGHKVLKTCVRDVTPVDHPRPFNASTCSHVISDATPRYFHSNFGGLGEPGNLAPHRIAHMLPDGRAKLILMFRNPTDRLLSDYRYFERQKGRANVTSAAEFHARAVESARLFRACVAKLSERQCAYVFNLTQMTDELANSTPNALNVMFRTCIGMYAIFVETWLSAFPRSSLHFVLFEEYIQNPNQYIREKIIPFLGLNPFDTRAENYLKAMSNDVVNRGSDVMQPKKMWAKTRDVLDELYAPFNDRLATMLKDERFRWKRKS